MDAFKKTFLMRWMRLVVIRMHQKTCYEEWIIVVANEKEIPDYDEFAWEVVDH